MVAVAQGIDPIVDEHPAPTKAAEAEAPSFDEIEHQRAINSRHLELREQAIQSERERLRFEQRLVSEQRADYDRLLSAFEKRLGEMKGGQLALGRENVRLIWENIKPKQAKEQILEMVEAGESPEVVSILSAMPIGKRAKIVSEFKSEEETKKLSEIMTLIRQGVPDIGPIDETQAQLERFDPNKTR